MKLFLVNKYPDVNSLVESQGKSHSNAQKRFNRPRQTASQVVGQMDESSARVGCDSEACGTRSVSSCIERNYCTCNAVVGEKGKHLLPRYLAAFGIGSSNYVSTLSSLSDCHKTT